MLISAKMPFKVTKSRYALHTNNVVKNENQFYLVHIFGSIVAKLNKKNEINRNCKFLHSRAILRRKARSVSFQ